MSANANKEQAERALEMGIKFYRARNFQKALKLFSKSARLCPLPQTREWTEKAAHQYSRQKQSEEADRQERARASSSGGRRQNSGPSSSHPRQRRRPAPERPRATSNAANMRSKATDPAVKRILACRTAHWYDILELDSNCSDKDIKKAYRKLARATHPDKNQTPGAEEAFKRVSEAFATLNDKEKRAEFDRYGPPAEEGRAEGEQTHARFRRHQFDAEDIFQQFFFGGGMPHHHQGGGRHFHQQQHENNAQMATLMRLLPIILLFLWTALANFGLQEARPNFMMHRTRSFNTERHTRTDGVIKNVQYFVESDFLNRVVQNNRKKLQQVELQVERQYLRQLSMQCQREKQQMRYDLYMASGYRETQKQIRRRRLPGCEQYQKYTRL